jgi:SAM-dependent methyltransferase
VTRVLDLGCGEGRHAIAAWLRAEVHCVGIDLSVQDVATAAARARPFAPERPAPRRQPGFRLWATRCRLPFADHCFDVVICSEVLEHIGPYREVLAEIRRVLKPGGALVASVPRYWPERVCWALSDAYHANEGGHIRIFRAARLNRDIEALASGATAGIGRMPCTPRSGGSSACCGSASTNRGWWRSTTGCWCGT